MPLTSLPAPWISPLRESCSPVSESSPSFSTRSPNPLSIPPSPKLKPPSALFSSCFLITCLHSFKLNSVLLHFGVKGFVVHLEKTRGLDLVPPRYVQGVNDSSPLDVDRAASDDLPQRQIAPPLVEHGGMFRRHLLHDDLACYHLARLGAQSEMLLVNHFFGQQHGAAHHRPKLTHISRPAVGQHCLDRRRRESPYELGKLDIRDVHESLGEVWDVFATLAQRRDNDRVFVQPKVKVWTERATFAKHFQVHAACRQHPSVNLDWLDAAQPVKSLFLEHPEQLGLRGERHVGNFIQKECACMCFFDLAHRLLIGPGEGSPLVSEQLALKERLGNRAAVDGKEW